MISVSTRGLTMNFRRSLCKYPAGRQDIECLFLHAHLSLEPFEDRDTTVSERIQLQMHLWL